jgi:Na+-translocating ferredoxin:NAD+ oxidoreductase RNF subunit RnfB
MSTVLVTAIFSAGLAAVLGAALGVFRRVFHVETDVLVEAIRGTLPGANCGACGFAGCDGFALAVAAKESDPGRCTVSSLEETQKRAALVGATVTSIPTTALVCCRVGNCESNKLAISRGTYTGMPTCRGAKSAVNGTKLCSFGCIGFGDCVKVCKFGAIEMHEGLPEIDREKCAGCRACVAECPQGLIRPVVRSAKGAYAVCNNRRVVKSVVKQECSVGCIKCEQCVKKCPQGALSLKKGIPYTDYSKCDSCGDCVKACPQKVIAMLEC